MKCFSGKKDKASFKYLDKASFRHFDKAERQGIFQASCQGKKTRHLSGTLTRQKDKASFRHLAKAKRQGTEVNARLTHVPDAGFQTMGREIPRDSMINIAR